MNVLSKFSTFVDEISASNSRLYKEAMLQSILNDDEIKNILHFIFNPYIITGISTSKSTKYKNKININKFSLMDLIEEPKDYTNLNEMLEYFKFHNTGKDEDLQEPEKYAQHNAPYQELIYSIITKDLKLGVQPTTLNKIFGKGFIPTFDVMLAHKYFDNPDKLVPDGTQFILTPKLDGVRCVLFNDGFSGPKFFSRQGQLIEQLIELEEEVKQLRKLFFKT